MFKNLVIAIIFSIFLFLGTYWSLVHFGFGNDPRENICPVRWEVVTQPGNFQDGDQIVDETLFFRSGVKETPSYGGRLVAQYVCNLDQISVFGGEELL